MRVCNFTLKGERSSSQRLGLIEGDHVFGLAKGSKAEGFFGPGGVPDRVGRVGAGYPVAEVSLCAPVPRPGKILATIVNTQGMLGGSDVRLERPRIDMKAPSGVIGPEEMIRGPKGGIRPEVELAAVVGRRISRASKAEADEAIFGFTVLNDVTAPADSREDAYDAYRRDRATGEIRKTTLRGPLFRSKNHDTFCPMGPWIVTREEREDWSQLRMTTKYDGVLVQDGSTSEYLFDPAEIASYVSQFLSLEPGDVISCGSVGWTREALGDLDPTEYVLPSGKGTLELEIEGIGILRNPVSVE